MYKILIVGGGGEWGEESLSALYPSPRKKKESNSDLRLQPSYMQDIDSTKFQVLTPLG